MTIKIIQRVEPPVLQTFLQVCENCTSELEMTFDDCDNIYDPSGNRWAYTCPVCSKVNIFMRVYKYNC